MDIYNLTDYCTYVRQYIEASQKSPFAKSESDFKEDLRLLLAQNYPERGAFYLTIADFMGGLTRTLYAPNHFNQTPTWIGGEGGDIDNKQEFIATLNKIWPEFFNVSQI